MVDKVLSTTWQRARGVIGRYPAEGERYVFTWSDVAHRPIHMVGVRKPLRVTWRVSGKVTKEAVLDPWTGSGAARADEVIEERP